MGFLMVDFIVSQFNLDKFTDDFLDGDQNLRDELLNRVKILFYIFEIDYT